MILEHFAHSGAGSSGRIYRRDVERASQLYADDAVLEWPQGQGRIQGRTAIAAFRSASPNRLDFEVHRITGCHDLWINEYTIRSLGRPVRAVGIMEFRDGKVGHERIYLAQHWDPPSWRSRRLEHVHRESRLVPA
jgi:hypothetical protein